MEQEIQLPKLGESITNARVVEWLKQEGDRVELDEPLLEVSTDKVNSEIPSPVAGVISALLVEVDDEVDVGAPLLKIRVEGEETASPTQTQESVQSPSESNDDEKKGFFSPAVLRVAQTEGVSLEELHKIEGSGEGGRVTKKDLERHLTKKKETKAPCATACQSKKPGVERFAMTGMRKMIAENLVRSVAEAPHASLVIEADVTDCMTLIAREKERFLEAHGVKLTITTFLVQALSKALGQFPLLNASVEEETIVVKNFINVGIAVHVEEGLMVPILKHTEERNLVSIAKGISDLSKRARESKLAPDEVRDGTVTLTNFGMTGALIGTPILRHPEVAILGAGAIQKKVVVRDDDALVVRRMMYLSLTFDHRVVDGIYGCQFLAAVKEHLESLS